MFFGLGGTGNTNDVKEINLDQTPQSIVRLASAVHRFRVPTITKKVSFIKAFKTVGTADATRLLMLSADEARESLFNALSSTSVHSDRVITDAKRYHPFIHTVLVSCKTQPEQARLDERLVFEWKSGLEAKPVPFKSDIMMYEFVMTLAAVGLGHALSATENSVAGEYTVAARDYGSAAGVFHLLADEQLPKWTSKGDIDAENVPIECHPAMAKAIASLLMANGQQMAIATLLIKDGKPNCSLLSKLCYGVAEQLEQTLNLMKGKAANQMNRVDADFLTLTTFSINMHKVLSMYYQARSYWDHDEHGVAIALLSEASTAVQPNSKNGLSDIKRLAAFKHLEADIADFRDHMISLLRLWEKENSSIYFGHVPSTVPANKKLSEGVQMKKKTDFVVDKVEPVLLSVPKVSILGNFFRK